MNLLMMIEGEGWWSKGENKKRQKVRASCEGKAKVKVVVSKIVNK